MRRNIYLVWGCCWLLLAAACDVMAVEKFRLDELEGAPVPVTISMLYECERGMAVVKWEQVEGLEYQIWISRDGGRLWSYGGGSYYPNAGRAAFTQCWAWVPGAVDQAMVIVRAVPDRRGEG